MRTYAIGDIHGALDKLEEVHARIAADRRATGDAEAPVVHIGDLVDRGPDSRGVIDFLLNGIGAGAPWIAIKGNHDRMFTGFLDDPDSQDPGLREGLHWIDPALGGDRTLASYGVGGAGERMLFDLHEAALRAVPPAHVAFLNGLALSHRRGKVLFVHAGIRPGVPLAEQSEGDLLWIRRAFLDDRSDHGALVVHGHTPVDAVTHYGNRVNIDTGAGYGRALAAVVIEGKRVWLLGPGGREAVLPRGVPAP
ncbi:metallophosphoesterase family protein [Albidovulum sp.]|uniref:metallophosphoesterase family protein n=1 Tax=Albidovulum sp. TaxID=1872424 RepID=UPI0039B87FAF